jgi:hypothetical protein
MTGFLRLQKYKFCPNYGKAEEMNKGKIANRNKHHSSAMRPMNTFSKLRTGRSAAGFG